MQARRSSLYVPAAGAPPDGPPADTILFYDDFSASTVEGQNLTDRTPAGTNAVAGTSYSKMAVSPYDNETSGAANVRAKPEGDDLTYHSTEILPASGLEWGTYYHAVESTARVDSGGYTTLGLWCSAQGSPEAANPTNFDGVLLWVVNSGTDALFYGRVRNNSTDVYTVKLLQTTAKNTDVMIRIEAEIIGDTVHFAFISGGILRAEDTVLFDVSKNNTRVVMGNRRRTINVWASRHRFDIQVDTYRNFLS